MRWAPPANGHAHTQPGAAHRGPLGPTDPPLGALALAGAATAPESPPCRRRDGTSCEKHAWTGEQSSPGNDKSATSYFRNPALTFGWHVSDEKFINKDYSIWQLWPDLPCSCILIYALGTERCQTHGWSVFVIHFHLQRMSTCKYFRIWCFS